MPQSNYSWRKKAWRSSLSKNKAVLEKLQFMREGKSLFEKNPKLDKWLCLLEIIFSKRFPHPDKPWEISYEYLPAWPEPTEEEIIRLCLCHTSYLPKFLKLHISLTKKSLNFRSSHQSCSIEKAVLKKFHNIHKKTTVLESLFNRVAGLKACNFIIRGTPIQQHRCLLVNIAKFLRTSILKKIFEQLPLEFVLLTVNISS